jgi:hypothetical protein
VRASVVTSVAKTAGGGNRDWGTLFFEAQVSGQSVFQVVFWTCMLAYESTQAVLVGITWDASRSLLEQDVFHMDSLVVGPVERNLNSSSRVFLLRT